MKSKIIKVSIFAFILLQTCKLEDICNPNDVNTKCGLTNDLIITNCQISTSPPAIPKNLNGTPNNGKITLNWNDSYCASQYNVYWSTTPNVNIVTANKIVTQEAKLTHSGIINGVTYYYKISAENSLIRKESGLSDEVFFSPSMATLKTFITGATYSIPTIGSVAGADSICNSDGGKPSGGSTYKALLVDESGCSSLPCRRASITANVGDGQIDWVLKPNTNYVRADGVTPIMTTNANGLFIFGTLTNSWTTAAVTGISGMAGTWNTFSNSSCSNYSNGATGTVTTTQYNQTGSGSLSSAGLSCTNSYSLLCIEQ
ncbi:DUF1554 domain-containing protein [Leptospira noumeaensis]|uniref:DUF1554 domain-containing protein n=1 Tax=Leptospira noumeaensis TaxID=2484964 RepID=A0A4R9IH22_9LEPT|nr:DUF1554 domain-containing protein [Leptospira noumeaensis]TGK87680.1 DUF1554 domain-containing protein [Leptospira noumeaensis]